MSATDKLFGGSIPEIYERLLVPLLFEPYANDLAERVLKNGPADILETAAGTGVLTRAMASRLPQSARIVATDLNQPMLDKAKALRVATTASSGGRPTHRRCRSQMKASTPSSVILE